MTEQVVRNAKTFNRKDYPRPMHKVLSMTLQNNGYVCPRCKQPFYQGDMYTRKRITNKIGRNGNIYHATCIVDSYGEPIY